MPGADELRAQALEVARGWSAPGAPRSWRLTAALFEAIAAHEDLLERLAVLPADRLPALLGSAAIAFLVRRDRPVPLSGYFPEPGQAQPRFDDGFFPAFGTFCAARLDDIAELCQGRRYQMNEVARCTHIALGIAAASAGSAGPVALIDLGTGAGLGLHLDRYRYRVGTGTFGPAAADLTLTCEVRGPIVPPPAELPPTAQQSAAPGQVMDSSAAPLAPSPAVATRCQRPVVSCCSSGPRGSESVLPPGAVPVWPTAQHCAALGQATAVR